MGNCGGVSGELVGLGEEWGCQGGWKIIVDMDSVFGNFMKGEMSENMKSYGGINDPPILQLDLSKP
jgi:hypothetical protein